MPIAPLRSQADLLEIYHLRRAVDNTGLDITSRGSLSVQRADKTNFEELRQYYTGTTYTYDYGQFEFPLYWLDASRIYIAPDFTAGDEFEMTYYQEVPELGSIVGLVNSDYMAINDSDQTLAQWVAAGNSAASFVQATEPVLANLWSSTIPHLLKAGACREAEEYLNNMDRAAIWNEQYRELLIATETEYRKFDAGGSQFITQSTAY